MNIIKIKNILIIFTGTTFINIAFAFDGWFSPDQARCKIEYTRLNLVTGVETRIKHTYQEDDEDDYCGTFDGVLGEKIQDWLMEDRKNILVDMSAMYCKTRTDDGPFSNKWSEYKQCGASDSSSVLSWVTAGHSYLDNQKGYNAHKLRLKGLVWEEKGIYNAPYD
jgi:hypothetical protein